MAQEDTVKASPRNSAKELLSSTPPKPIFKTVGGTVLPPAYSKGGRVRLI